jgi:anti-sigma B factor antagonist
MEATLIPADLQSRGAPMTTLDLTPSFTDDSAAASLLPGIVRKLGARATIRLATRGPAPVTVSITGEIDLACADDLATLLCASVDAYPQGIDLDLASVRFCDCRGLTSMLTARAHARHRGRHFALGPHSPTVARLLELTGTRSALTTPH